MKVGAQPQDLGDRNNANEINAAVYSECMA